VRQEDRISVSEQVKYLTPCLIVLLLGSFKVFLLGVAYKPGVSDTRESPALDIAVELEDHGATVTYHDPYVDSVTVGDRTYRSQPFSRAELEASDCVVVVTDHDEIDVEAAVEAAPLVFDARNATAGIDADHVHRL